MSLPTSDYLRDIQIADELAHESAEAMAVQGITWDFFSGLGDPYGNQAFIDGQRGDILAYLRGEPAGRPIRNIQADETTLYAFPTSGPNQSEIERVLTEHPEMRAQVEEALAREQPIGPTVFESFEQTYGPIGERIQSGLSAALRTGSGLLTLVIVGIVGLTVIAAAR